MATSWGIQEGVLVTEDAPEKGKMRAGPKVCLAVQLGHNDDHNTRWRPGQTTQPGCSLVFLTLLKHLPIAQRSRHRGLTTGRPEVDVGGWIGIGARI